VLDEAKRAAHSWFEKFAIEPLGAGHIHDTYLVTAADRVTATDPQARSSPDDPPHARRVVLQRVNEAVFRDPDLVMRQTERLLHHLAGGYPYAVPALIVSRAGRTAERVADGFWRAWAFLADTVVVDPLRTASQAEAAGQAFGTFQHALEGLPGPRFDDTIRGFLQLAHYLESFEDVAATAPPRLARLIADHADLADRLGQRNAHIHGDCKVNNLLFDADAREVCAVIDFDTAMYGHWAWDLGDLLRSVCYSGGGLDLELYRAALGGFLRGSRRGDCAADELLAAPAYVTFMLGIRFLTDHLRGDVYFRVSRRGDNLRRAEEQFGLLGELLDAEDRLEAIVDEVRRSLTPD
jgi:hypothetical protein